MLNLSVCEVETTTFQEPDEPYPNSALPTIDASFLKGLVPEEPVEVSQGFWRRQFGSNITCQQSMFDWLFGLIMPAICFYFDPFVFRSETGGALLERYQFSTYMISGLAIMAMVTWLLFAPKLAVLNSLFSGLFAISGVIALTIGIILFPFSLIGMFFIIGVLGYVPFFTSFVLFRNAVRAYGAASQ